VKPLNSPLEVGLRVLMLLQEAFPQHLDLNQLVLLDHSLLHSADLGGPESLHPAVPIRAGELGIKREAIEAGLEVMIRAELAQAGVGDGGIEFWASESADGFTNLLETSCTPAPLGSSGTSARSTSNRCDQHCRRSRSTGRKSSRRSSRKSCTDHAPAETPSPDLHR
jgi:hypothetical protein